MQGRKPFEYKLSHTDRRYLKEIVADGQQIQRVANRARALLALADGERVVDILRWIGVSRAGLWYLWQRYQQRGVAAIFDEERSGRPPTFSPSGARPDRAGGLHRPSGVWVALDPLGLPQSGAGRR